MSDWLAMGNAIDPLLFFHEQSSCASGGRPRSSCRSSSGADREHPGACGMAGYHPARSQRVHLLGRGCQAAGNQGPSNPPDQGRARGGHAAALLLARLHPSRAHRSGGLTRRKRGETSGGGLSNQSRAHDSERGQPDDCSVGVRPPCGPVHQSGRSLHLSVGRVAGRTPNEEASASRSCFFTSIPQR